MQARKFRQYFWKQDFRRVEAVATTGGKPDRKSVYHEVVIEDEDMRARVDRETKSEPGAVATGPTVNLQGNPKSVWSFSQSNLWPVATAPGSDFVSRSTTNRSD